MMLQIELKPTQIDPKGLKKRPATVSDVNKLYDSPALFTLEGKPKIAYGKLEAEQTLQIKNALKNLKYIKDIRTSGLKTESVTFGYLPRNTIRHDFCKACQLAYTMPKHHAALCSFGKLLAEKYKKHFPKLYLDQKEFIEKKVLKSWNIPETPFTSGIANRNNSLKYHYDTGNVPGLASCMVVFKKNIRGGVLCLPEYGIGIDICDSGYLIFDGQSILHGVSQIKKLNKNSYRYSAVYYALQTMKNCETPEKEINRIRALKRQREIKRL